MAQPRTPRDRPNAANRRGASNSTMLIAVAVSLLLAATAILLSRGGGAPAAHELDETLIPDVTGPVGEVPDIRDGGGISTATNATVQLKDRNDPGRIAWELEFDAIEPDTDDIIRPRAWYFLGADSAVYVRADHATLVQPEQFSEPESGRFTGNVELLQIDRNADGTLPDPLPENSSVRITTAWLEFDSVAGELSTTETVTILSESIEAECEGVRLVLNEVDQRLEYFEVPGRLVATILPPGGTAEGSAADPRPAETSAGALSAADGQPKVPAASGSTQSPIPSTGQREAAQRQFYAAVFEGGLRVSQPARRINADRARAWMELVDNALPDAGFARSSPAEPVGPAIAGPIHAAVASLTLASAAQPGTIEPDAIGLDEPIRFECAGPVTIRPMSDRPLPLGSGDSLAVRFESNESERVTFVDDELAAEGDADWMEYAFTNKLLTLSGTADTPSRTTMAETGTLVAEQVTIGLATGVGQATGSGLLSDASGTRSVSWRDQADVVFRTENGWMTGSLEQAIASGSVRLSDDSTLVTAEDANARFARADSSAVIERVVLTGRVSVSTKRGSLTARRADLRFIVEGEGSSPHLAIATGDVRGEQDGQRVRADQIEADLAPAEDDENDVRVTAARAAGSVRYDRDDGTFAEGDSISVDAAASRVIAQGSPGRIGTPDGVIEGTRIELDDTEDAISVPGPGRLTLHNDEGVLTRVAASWTDSMRYVDSTGDLLIAGDAELVSTPDALQRDTIRGGLITAVISPPAESDDAGEAAEGLAGDRTLVAAVIERQDAGEPPSIELLSRPDPEAEPDRVVLLTGNRIEADNAAATLTVPGAGRLLVADRRVGFDELDAGERGSNTANGSALFDWDGDMRLDRRDGAAVMRQRVRLIHRPAQADRGDIELECERLVTSFEADGSARLLDEAGDREIGPIDATGAVWARSGEQQMLADAIAYEPGTGVANASAAPGGWVTLFDPGRSASVTAEQLLWSIDTGRIEVVRPSPVEIPNQ